MLHNSCSLPGCATAEMDTPYLIDNEGFAREATTITCTLVEGRIKGYTDMWFCAFTKHAKVCCTEASALVLSLVK